MTPEERQAIRERANELLSDLADHEKYERAVCLDVLALDAALTEAEAQRDGYRSAEQSWMATAEVLERERNVALDRITALEGEVAGLQLDRGPAPLPGGFFGEEDIPVTPDHAPRREGLLGFLDEMGAEMLERVRGRVEELEDDLRATEKLATDERERRIAVEAERDAITGTHLHEWIARAEAAETALLRIAAIQPRVLELIEANGFVFDSIGKEPGNWQHLAFTIYTELCEVDTIARAVVKDGVAHWTDEQGVEHSGPFIDPTCAFHGMKWSEHEGGRCLYCPMCFRSDFGYPHWVDADGQKWDLCQECGERENAA